MVNVNYRHAPEHKYPVAWNDTEDAFHWVHDHLSEIGGDGANLVMGGVSAGGWLTASTAIAQATGNDKSLAARPKIKGQVLIIPGLVHYDCYESQVKRLRDPSVSSWVQNRDAPVIPFERVQLFFDALGVKDGKGRDADLRLNPGNASAEQVKGLPPATFGVAGMDPLRDEGLLFAQLLAENGYVASSAIGLWGANGVGSRQRRMSSRACRMASGDLGIGCRRRRSGMRLSWRASSGH